MGTRREFQSVRNKADYIILRGADNPKRSWPERPRPRGLSFLLRELTAGGTLKKSTRHLRGRGRPSRAFYLRFALTTLRQTIIANI